MSSPPTRIWFDQLVLVGVALIWGGSFWMIKEASAVFGPMSVSLGRLLGSVLVLGAIWRWRGMVSGLKRSDLPWLGLIAIMGYALPFTIQPFLIGRHQESAFFGTMVCLVPLLTLLISIPLLRQKPTLRQIIGVVGGLSFFAWLLIGDGGQRKIPAGHLVLAVLVPLGYAVGNVMVKRQFSDRPALCMACVVCAVAGLIMGPLALSMESVAEVPQTQRMRAAGLIAILGLVNTGLATWLFYSLIQRRGPLYAGMITYLIPIVAIVIGALDGEVISMRQKITIGGVLTMVWLTQRDSAPRGKATVQTEASDLTMGSGSPSVPGPEVAPPPARPSATTPEALPASNRVHGDSDEPKG